MKKFFSFIGLIVVLSLVLAACAPAATPAPTMAPTATSAPQPTATPMPAPTEAPKTIVDIALADGRFTTLVAALQAAGLVETLAGDGPFTVFAPTDDAFAKLPAGTVEALLADPEQLKAILLYHVVAGKVMASDAKMLNEAETVNGAKIMITAQGEVLKINDSQVVLGDIKASNGVIHVIDAVLLPPQKNILDIAAENGSFTTLLAAIQAAGLEETLMGEGPFTVFAPTDDAFAKLPSGTVEALLADPEQLKNILLYHVVPGKLMATDVVAQEYLEMANGESARIKMDSMGNASIDGARIATVNVEAGNGVIHVLDSVILPGKSVADIAVNDGRFTTLVAALQAAGLVETLQGEGPFTVFAPTDDAFAKLPAGTVEALLKDIPALTKILLYHVVPGNLLAADVTAMDYLPTAQGESVRIKVDMGKAYINSAQIIVTDIKAKNGVVHVIDSVILPGQTIADVTVNDGRFTTLVAALQAANLVETLKGAGPFTVFAPTDEAFAKLPAGTVEALLKDIPTLSKILLYHVVAGAVKSDEVVTLTSADTVAGQPVSIKVQDGKVFINESQVIIVDIMTGNGIIHVIDTVLLPQ